MFLNDSDEIRTAIRGLVAGHKEDEPVGMAVAFWGSGAEAMLPAGRRYRVICNLSMGGTNPKVIADLMGRPDVDVRHLPNLHAKVLVAAGGAVVSSANFSANGLGLEEVASLGWQEAGVFIPAGDPEFVRVYGWFARHWRGAMPVTEEVLEQAARQWHPRVVGQPEPPLLASPAEAPATAPLTSVPELAESDLFQAKLKPRNAIRMAATWLVDEYARVLGRSLKTTEHYIPAYAAHVLWTKSGKRIATRIKSTPVFSMPDEVFRRAEELSSAFPSQVWHLLRRLPDSPRAPDAVRYWAGRCVESKR